MDDEMAAMMVGTLVGAMAVHLGVSMVWMLVVLKVGAMVDCLAS